jgi:UDP-N-acetylmuramoylalanine--D-glutamate ligase
MVFVFGRDRNKLADALGDLAVISETMAEAFDLAVAAANPGDIVLLSPACASLDQFPDYQSRGAYFEKLVRKLNEA